MPIKGVIMTGNPLTSAQISLGLSSHNNHYLFSDHYLNHILKTDPRWTDAIAAGDGFLAWVSAVYQQEEAQLPHYSEAQLEAHWFKPILDQLGHVYEGQTAVPGLDAGIKYPDYVFYPDEARRQQAAASQGTSAATRHALGLGEVKAWNVPLGKKSGGKPSFDNNNPSYQIDYYLRTTELDWGILSNGRLWRLVHRDSSYKLDVYFEIDLEQAIVDQNRAAAIFFVLFFRQAAFRRDAQGRRFLQDALKASAAYAVQLETDLRDSAYKALEQLIQGFIEPSANGLSADDLPTIYTNSLYLLYRILFLFYGESRGLLPMANPQYQDYSLTKLARDVARQLDSGQQAPPMTSHYWHRLQTLFRIINGDQPDLNAHLGVPRYNGGLFNPELHPFLETHFVGDRYLLAAIDVLARREVGDKKSDRRRENVDYRTLGVRQLGSIYEGLLEYQPRRAAEPMVAVRRGKQETWIPLRQKPKRARELDSRAPGDVYLTTDKGERKATGSYYTPDYIVKYLVEQTLGPLVEAARQRVKARARQQSEDAAARTAAQAFPAEILRLNVLDPAMGSGHFLVEATDFLARAIATDAYVPGSAAETEDDLTYWRRQVVEACIYGVDKNRMAMELAKLSLWLVTVARDKPLSFLDHHLQHGDSLVGARLADVNSLPTGRAGSPPADQPPLLDEAALTRDAFRAVGGMRVIETLLSNSIDDIHHKERLLADLQAYLTPWRRVADLWTSRAFGNEMSAEEYADLLRHLQGKPAAMSAAQQETFLAHPAVTDQDYFHWELAFPEVFFDEYGRLHPAAGFDAVVGNPPYVRQEYLTPYKPFFQSRFQSYAGTADLYLYFYEQGVRLLNENGRIAYISSGTFAKTRSAQPFRRWLPDHAQIETLIDFGENQPFEGAEMVRPSIVIMRKGQQIHNFRSMFMDGTTIWRPLDQALEKHGFECDATILQQPEWTFQSLRKFELFEKLMAVGTPLNDYIEGRMYRGIVTGLNDAFYIDSKTRSALIETDPNSAQIIRPMLRGADLRPWYQQNEGRWLIFTRRGVNIENYPAVRAYLAQFRPLLEPMPEDWNAKNKWVGRKAGPYEWYEIQDSVAYFEEMEWPKILWPDITKLPRFSLDIDGQYVNQKCYLIPEQHPSLLGVLQSRVTWFAISQICTPLRLRAGLWQYQVLAQFVSRLPIPTMKPAEKASLGDLAMQITALAKTRYQLHQQVRHRIQADLGAPDRSLNNALTAWWTLGFPAFRRELKKAFGRDVPLAERDAWEAYLGDRRAEHAHLTNAIIAHETDLNRQVYALFDLTPAEIRLVEESTKYPYGAV